MNTQSPFSTPESDVTPPPTNNKSVAIVVIVVAAVLVLGLMCTGILAALLLPAVSSARDAARSMQVMNQMKQIGIAIHNYHAAYNQLPPAFATDSNDNPRHSWRVTLMPFLEEQARWQQWNQNETWDSAANAPLHTPPPLVFVSPFESDLNSPQTHVFAVRHPNGSMSGERVVRFNDLTDGMASTILAVYLPNRTVNWTAPEDITLDELKAEFASASTYAPLFVVCADGGVYRFATPVDPADVEAMVTRSGEEAIDYELFQ